MQINSAKDLTVYKSAYKLSMDIFQVTKSFPNDEVYALTSQIRRSSRSVCTNLREAWAKRRYEAHFLSKLTDADGEMEKPKPGSILPVTVDTFRKTIVRHLLKSVAKSERCWGV